jgi:hypothetical protein
MKKEYILSEIKRTAKENGGGALGRQKFFKYTGIRESDWLGKYWARWNDAVIEAGIEPNQLQASYDENWLLEMFIGFVKELGRFPTPADLRIKAFSDSIFPAQSTFRRRFGRKSKLAKRIVQWCEERDDLNEVIKLCLPHCQSSDEDVEFDETEEVSFGYVYLMKSGKFYKIGRSNAPGRRKYELGIKLPEELKTVHIIKTDDPVGIEEYWHKRFNAKRKGGEWFDLDASDVNAFKRRKFM